MTATRQPAERHRAAATEAAVPVPITTRSYFFVISHTSNIRTGATRFVNLRRPLGHPTTEKPRAGPHTRPDPWWTIIAAGRRRSFSAIRSQCTLVDGPSVSSSIGEQFPLGPVASKGDLGHRAIGERIHDERLWETSDGVWNAASQARCSEPFGDGGRKEGLYNGTLCAFDA